MSERWVSVGRKYCDICKVSFLDYFVFTIYNICFQSDLLFLNNCTLFGYNALFQVWFADNRASIEFHERGEKHKNAMAQKLRDVGKSRELKLHAVSIFLF